MDEAHRLLGSLGVASTSPALYAEYAPDYYATFFQDPDGIRLEIVARRAYRDDIVRDWARLRSFLNPMQELREREG